MNSADPANRLVLDLRGRAGVDRQVDVVGVGQEVGEGADLEAARADEREVARPRLRDRLVEDARGVIERLVDGLGPWGRPASRSRRTRSSSGGSSGRNRSKLRHASVDQLAACSSASSRGASSRSGRSGCVIAQMVRRTQEAPTPSEWRSPSASLAGARPPITIMTIAPITSQPSANQGASTVGLVSL